MGIHRNSYHHRVCRLAGVPYQFVDGPSSVKLFITKLTVASVATETNFPFPALWWVNLKNVTNCCSCSLIMKRTKQKIHIDKISLVTLILTMWPSIRILEVGINSFDMTWRASHQLRLLWPMNPLWSTMNRRSRRRLSRFRIKTKPTCCFFFFASRHRSAKVTQHRVRTVSGSGNICVQFPTRFAAGKVRGRWKADNESEC